MMEPESGYQQIYRGLLARLVAVDFAEAAKRLGFAGGRGEDGNPVWRVLFLGQEYAVSSHGVWPIDGKPVPVNDQNVLAYYVISPGAGEPSGEFCPINRLAGRMAGRTDHTGWMLDPLRRALSGSYERFCGVMRRLGGEEICFRSGGQVWAIRALPKIPMQVVFYAADSEFPCDIQVLFDTNAPRFLEFECLAFLQGCLIGRMVELCDQDEITS